MPYTRPEVQNEIMEIIFQENREILSRIIAEKIITLVQHKPNCVLGLATGSSPLLVYQDLIQAYEKGRVSFRKTRTFNLDEYLGCSTEKDTYRYFMDHELFDHIDIDKANTHFPDPACPKEYDRQIALSPIDFQLLGIGADGHIGFNEPGTSFDSLTHIAVLTEKTRRDNSRFFASFGQVPEKAVTMGLYTIMQAQEIALIALGASKKTAISQMFQEENTACPASILKKHRNAVIYIDWEK